MENRKQKALETIQALIDGQLKAKARIWGSVEAIPEIHRKRAGGMLMLTEHPELSAVAPTDGEFETGGFKIWRKTVDRVVRITVKLA